MGTGMGAAAPSHALVGEITSGPNPLAAGAGAGMLTAGLRSSAWPCAKTHASPLGLGLGLGSGSGLGLGLG